MRCSDRAHLRRSLGVLFLLALLPAPARAQGLFERLGLDKLRLTSIGLGYGPTRPSKVEATHSFALQVDYGQIAPRWHVVFSASYWESSYTDDVVREFEDQLRRTIRDPSGDDVIDIGRIRVSDVALEMEARYMTGSARTVLRPYAGLAVGVHAINAESPFIQGTFVESALDNISTGVSGVAGLQIAPTRRLSFAVQGRYTMLSQLRFATIRGLVNYHFGLPRVGARGS
jgi:hypothetical protein